MKKEQESWMNKRWRPAMAWMYMGVCIFDFVLFPIGFTLVQFYETQAANDAFRQWQPMTLIGGGLFHMAMGVVLGITSWSRGQEKISGVSTVSTSVSTPQMFPSSYTPAPVVNYRNTTFDELSPVYNSFRGKKAPPEPHYPEI